MSVNNQISVIIPVLNDAAALARCLSALKLAQPASTQIIVIDGGPSDECKRVALEAGAEYLAAPRGRASQMSAGAKLARGEWLWFLHADCIPHPDSLQAIAQQSTLDPVPPPRKRGGGQGVGWGCFKHRINAPSLALRVIE